MVAVELRRWAELMHILDNIEWSENVVTSDRSEWTPLNEPLRPGSQYWIKCKKIGKFKHGVFRPALSAINGWADSPREISLSGVAEFTFHTSVNDWHKVTVRNFFALGILARLAIKESITCQLPNHICTANYDGLQLYESFIEGDVHEWYLMSGSVMILYSLWTYKDEYETADLLVEYPNEAQQGNAPDAFGLDNF